MNSYIVRIYRQGQNGNETIVGLVEDPASACRRPFKSVDELCAILSSPNGICRRRKRRDVGLYRRQGDRRPDS